ncbi:hypothetical protein PTSG_06139 [Salpingoeca rosetta]|uniref:Hormone-sensitive lipase n=1 Tax=Salpingoeca rosetta (strain ATCC 50818 / BSB-021) TaxID=946362 RepID=F2UC22_SALR5|nr:uncharacterized protein PTSG_06139 [Salpingoeca rosetta]EGD74129.1 hypothetical protein PTSG_06139 [Salpingoeca rosetta]|eukprot:XP_004993030.1 hypothetical protein PTSG_06139 [Salpingoeca rosetta]
MEARQGGQAGDTPHTTTVEHEPRSTRSTTNTTTTTTTTTGAVGTMDAAISPGARHHHHHHQQHQQQQHQDTTPPPTTTPPPKTTTTTTATRTASKARQHADEEDTEQDEAAHDAQVMASKPETAHDLAALVRFLLAEVQTELTEREAEQAKAKAKQKSPNKQAKAATTATTMVGGFTAAWRRGASPERTAEIDHNLKTAVLNTIAAMHIVDWELPHIARRARSYRVGDFAPYNGYHALMTILSSILLAIKRVLAQYQESSKTAADKVQLSEALQEHGAVVLHAYVRIFGKGAELAQHAGNEDIFFKTTDVAFQDRLMTELESAARECFFGRHLAFYHLAPIRSFLQSIARALVSYSHGAQYTTSTGAFASSLASWFHYMYKYVCVCGWVNDELPLPVCDSMIETTIGDISQALDDLVLPEAMRSDAPTAAAEDTTISHHVHVLQQRQLTHNNDESDDWVVVDSQSLPTPFGELQQHHDFRDIVTQCVPSDEWMLTATTEEEHPVVKVRILSARARFGQLYDVDTGATRARGDAASPYVILHCHGGGFCAQSPTSHEIYLRQWAKSLDCPIVSVDYSLAPEAPYPRAVQECFYVYRWLLAHPEHVGTTAQRICLVGDSAGGNLVLAVTLKCLLEGVRPPSAVVCVYPALQMEYALSPSRLLSALDPLLPEGILRACMEAYTGEKCEDFRTTDPLLSPMTAPDHLLKCLPPVHLIAAGLDPLLDDSVAFALRLKRLGVPFHLKVFENMPHGFLNFPRTNPHVDKAFHHCLDQLRAVITGVIDLS